MRMVIQRVKYCKLFIEGNIYSSINKGIICYVGVSKNDSEKDVKWCIDKAIAVRIFEEDDIGNNTGKMNYSVKDLGLELMLVSQFTLFGDARKGTRPSYSNAAPIEKGKELYNKTVDYTKLIYDKDKIKTGRFQAYMDIEYINDGPVTILIDSEKKF